MKNSIRFLVGISLLVLFVFCSGCGTGKSEAEMKEAQQAMEKARSLFAEDIASSDWLQAMESWDQAQAAVKQGKPAKTLFLRAKSRFEKTASIAKSRGTILSGEVGDLHTALSQRLDKLKTSVREGRASSKVLAQIKPVVAEVEQGIASLEELMSKGNFFKAKILAKDLSAKAYKAELILQGKKPD